MRVPYGDRSHEISRHGRSILATRSRPPCAGSNALSTNDPFSSSETTQHQVGAVGQRRSVTWLFHPKVLRMDLPPVSWNTDSAAPPASGTRITWIVGGGLPGTGTAECR